ncbi:MAG: Fur family transcriptional regulator [Pseudomonadota bacterium]
MPVSLCGDVVYRIAVCNIVASIGFALSTISKDQAARGSRQSDLALDAAIALYRDRGAKLTPLREAVLAVLWSAPDPIGAYDLKDCVSASLGRTISATSIYRILEYFCDLGAALRIESRNAYMACRHPEHDNASVLLVCNACGASAELENKKLEKLLTADAKALGFTIAGGVIELPGSCANCCP